jgi:putative ABC transport system permease protein
MELAINLKTALGSLRRNKVRSLLTMLGIIIGISSFILIKSVGAGAQGLILDLVKKQGSNLIGVLPGASDEKGPPASAFGINITTLVNADAEAIARTVPNITAVTGYVRGSQSVTADSETRSAQFSGVSASYLEVEDGEVSDGRFFSTDEDTALAHVAVLGGTIAEELFPGGSPVGEQITFNGEKYSVIGVLKKRGTTIFSNQDDTVFIPLLTAQKTVLGIRHLAFLRAKVAGPEYIEAAMEDVKQLLRQRHHISDVANDDFSVRNTQDALSILTGITGALTLFLTAIAAISLVVGGIGIMNIMYVSVSERTYEIGLRKAIGAHTSDILGQFLIEALVVTSIAGVIGVSIGTLLSWATAVGARAFGFEWQLIISSSSIITALVIAAAIGLFFGVFPARTASKLTPIEALRYE